MSEELSLNTEEGQPIKLMVGLAWDPNEEKWGNLDTNIKVHNLDLSCAVLTDSMRVKDLITPDNPMRDEYRSKIFHAGDNLSGGSDFEDEEIRVDFEHLEDEIQGLAFVVSANNKIKFEHVKNGECAFNNAQTLEPFLTVSLDDIPGQHRIVGIVKRTRSGWALQKAEVDVGALDEMIIERALSEATV